jgi:hypothetical protein
MDNELGIDTWVPAEDISEEAAEETRRKFPKIRYGGTLDALARIVGQVHNLAEKSLSNDNGEVLAEWYEFDLGCEFSFVHAKVLC